MVTTTKTITEIINSDLLEYSMYVLQNRAIPSVIDGFKSGGRKLVYTMVNDYPTRKVKVAELAGSIAKYGFHHGESSAEGAVVTLTADWNNNCPVFTGHGNFGSRLIQEAAASRYIFVSLSPEFKKYFIDNEVTIKSLDEESPEPQHYLPIIPWILVPGISGIAVGFACNILPHSVSDLVSEVRTYLKNPLKYIKEQKLVVPTFPHFKGTVKSEALLSWSTTGIIEYAGKYMYKISELPIGYDRESYINILNGMVDSELIKDYEDDCSEDGFGFTVKVTLNQKEKIELDPIKYFKLKKTHSENLTTLGVNGKLKLFSSVPDLIAYFCEYRLQKFADKIEYEKRELLSQIEQDSDKIRFIEMVIDGKVKFKSLTKQELLNFIHDNITEKEHGAKFISIPMYQCTLDVLGALQSEIDANKSTYEKLEQTTPVRRYLEVLK